MRVSEYPPFAFTGKAGAGKSTCADFLETAGYTQVHIAGPLKDTAASLLGDQARKNRGFLQKLGQLVRDEDEDAWVRLMLQSIETKYAVLGLTQFVVDDLRFPNEWWKLKADGFVIVRVTAPRSLRIDRLKRIGKFQDESQLDDVSETAVDDLEPHHTIVNDRDDDYVYEQLRDVLARERRRV